MRVDILLNPETNKKLFVTIHRGSDQIGGSCVEIEHDGVRIVLDLGMPLSKPGGLPGEQFEWDKWKVKGVGELMQARILPKIPGLYRGIEDGPPVAALIITHAHGDHYGFAGFVRDDVPVYLTAGTRALMEASLLFLGPDRLLAGGTMPKRLEMIAHTNDHWRPRKVNLFTLRFHPVDHSAPGAMAVEVQAGGKTVFYSGDFRAGGYYGKLFPHLLKHGPKHVDLLLMEGTTLGRGEDPAGLHDEADVHSALVTELKDKKNLGCVFASSQNLDRIRVISDVAAELGMTFYIAPYTAYVLHLLAHAGIRGQIPGGNVKHIRILEDRSHEAKLAPETLHDITGGRGTVKLREMMQNRSKAIWLGREYLLKRFFRDKALDGDEVGRGGSYPFTSLRLIWSMWKGYRDRSDLAEWAKKRGLKWKDIHVSGHASRSDLAKLVDAMTPKFLVPIHTEWPAEYRQFHAKLREFSDGVKEEV